MRHRVLSSTTWFLILAVASVVQGAGEITGLSVNPMTVTVGEPVSITVEGTGTCQLTFDYGDNSSNTFAGAVMPRSASHVYDTVGAKHIIVTAPDCPAVGKNEADIRVSWKMEATGPPVDRTITPLIPWITGVLGWGVQAGTPLIIGGLKFGSQQGAVRILGSNGAFKLLEIEEWYDKGIGGFVPDDINDICVTGVQVVDADGVASHPKTLNVPLDIKRLSMSDVSVLRCDPDGDENRCNNQDFETEDIFECVEAHHMPFGPNAELHSNIDEGTLREGDPPPPPTISGGHHNCWGARADDSGHDIYRISLKNGWVLDSAQFRSSVPVGEGSTDPKSGKLPGGFVAGASSWEPRIDWTVSAADTVIYELWVTIRGPACASHK